MKNALKVVFAALTLGVFSSSLAVNTPNGYNCIKFGDYYICEFD